jgi:PAS domain S-box-containing protein
MKLDLKLTIAFALGLLIIVVVGVGSFVGNQQVAESNRMVAHTQEVLASLERTLSLLKDAETGQRGFVLTGEERYLGPYNAAVTEIGKETESLAFLTKDNPAQQQSIRQLAQLSHDKLEVIQTTIKLRRESGLNAALTVIRTDRGKRIMDEIRAVVAQMEAREWQLLDKRNRIAGEAALRNSRTVGLGMLLMLVLLAAAAVVMTRSLRFGEQGTLSGNANRKWPEIAVRYSFALAMVALAMLLRHCVISSFGPVPIFIMFYPAVLLVAIIAGGGPGILTTFVSVLAADYWYIPPIGEFAIQSPNDAISLGIFGSASMFLSVFAERLHRARLAESVSAAQEQELALLDMGNLLTLDLERRVVRWSQGCSRLYGFDAPEARGRLVDELLQTRNAQPWGEVQRTLLEHGYWEGEITRRGKNGTELSVTILLALRRDERGSPAAILEVSTDLTAQKGFQAALQANEACLRTANDSLQVVNEQLQAQTEELQTQSEELQSQAEELLAQNHELAKLWDESRLTKDALAESQERLMLALSSSKMGTFEWDIVNDKRIWDDGVHRLLMTNPLTFTGTAEEFYRVIHTDDRDAVKNALAKAVNTDGTYDTEYRAVWPDGTIRHIAARGKIHRNSAGQPYHMTGICWDISERKLVEEKLQKLNEELEERVAERTKELAAIVEKLKIETVERVQAVETLREKEQMLIQQSRQAAMGEMIGNIAHQWRQPLNTLGLTVQQLLLFYDMDGFTREFLENSVGKSMELIKHMSQTIDDFRNYFRPDKEKIEFKVQEAINSTLSLIEDSFKSQHIGVELVTADDQVIHGYRNEYAQVILNIMNNARDALTEREIQEPKVWLTIGSENGRAIVTIADNAGGIPEEIMGKIFDPYFTTKGPKTGTGVGLFMSKTIIEKNMGGRLTVQNTDNGAVFRIEV